MVCKEELFMWFQNLKGSKRIEAMCGLLNMCYPLELRFYGTCLEDLGRKDFYAFRDEETKSNNVAEILKIKNINDPVTRSRLIVILSLLNSSNRICSKELFKILTEEIRIESLASLGALSNAKAMEEFMLLLTLAQNHPAFTFEQQTLLNELGIYLENYTKEINARTQNENEEASLSSPVYPSPDVVDTINNTSHSFSHHKSESSQTRITSLKVKAPHKKMSMRIKVLWGSNKIAQAFKTPYDIAVFHQKLVQLFPSEAQVTGQEKFIPPLPHAIAAWNKENSLTESIIMSVTDYIQQLNLRLPAFVLESDFVTHFFLPLFHNRSALSRANKSSDARLPSFTIYNSQMTDNTRHKAKLTEPGNLVKSSPVNSPLSSPYVSPEHSESNSRSASPWTTFEKVLLKEHTLRNYTIDELQTMPTAELESLGVLREAGTKLRKALDNKSLCMPSNGVVGNYLPKSAIPVKAGLLPASNDSSPVCSEYSSPPQSPSPEEETTDKRPPIKPQVAFPSNQGVKYRHEFSRVPTFMPRSPFPVRQKDAEYVLACSCPPYLFHHPFLPPSPYMPPLYPPFPPSYAAFLVSCYNCGKVGHRGPDCKEQNIDEMSKPGKFQLNYAPVPKIPENHE